MTSSLVRTVSGRQTCLEVRVYPTAEDLGDSLALEAILACQAQDADALFQIGLPTGATPLPFFEALARRLLQDGEAASEAFLRRMRAIVMDDFLDPTSGKNIASTDPVSAPGFIERHLIDKLTALRAPASWSSDIVLYPRPLETGVLRNTVISRGGLALQILGTDPYEGHLGQNFPGHALARSEEDKVAPLSRDFIRHHPWAKKYGGVTFDFLDMYGMVAAHPTGRIVLVVAQEEKANILAKTLSAGCVTRELPLTAVWLDTTRTKIYVTASVDKRLQSFGGLQETA